MAVRLLTVGVGDCKQVRLKVSVCTGLELETLLELMFLAIGNSDGYIWKY